MCGCRTAALRRREERKRKRDAEKASGDEPAKRSKDGEAAEADKKVRPH